MATATQLRQTIRNLEYLKSLPHTDTSKMSIQELLRLIQKLERESS